jgi:hypothetical protein
MQKVIAAAPGNAGQSICGSLIASAKIRHAAKKSKGQRKGRARLR